MTDKLIFPCVRESGADASELLESLLEARQAIRAAANALCGAGPNGMDYWALGVLPDFQAQAQHFDRMNRLQSVIAELRAITNDVERQQAAIDERRKP